MKFYKAFLILLICAGVKSASAQGVQISAGGVPVQDRDMSDVVGSPYVNAEWGKGTVKLKDDKVYTNIDLKYSDYDDALYFKSAEDKMQSFAVPVVDFTISYAEDGNPVLKHFRNGYHIQGYDGNAYFEVFNEGKAQFLKKTKKKIETQSVYGSTGSDKKFVSTTKYFLVNGDKSAIVKKDKKSILEALGDKQTELEAYIKSNNLNLKEESDIAKLLTYYNSI
ncbi:hypothetical protein [Mucilaginibacter agri]|uniref:Uncharacterized protein n=1 Tax=Mucilaginibacter agri TaxID=2695265 RepID=A0A965ZED0_9SPHI|nr:hypothetical protein [Mucilaginibacter agri]NCD69513.1 hypothetical protein [Mucilaginibacter agri]